MSFIKKNEDNDVDINITPLIDVVFLLLLFFMLTTTFTSRPGFKINLPKTSSSATENSNENINIYISSSGEISFNDKITSINEISKLLKEKTSVGTNQMVIISADESSKHGIVVDVMDKIKENGFSKITIATQKKK